MTQWISKISAGLGHRELVFALTGCCIPSQGEILGERAKELDSCENLLMGMQMCKEEHVYPIK